VSDNSNIQRAFDMGKIKAKIYIHNALWNSPNTWLLLVKTRLKLDLNDPVINKYSGDLLRMLIGKTDGKTRKSLASILKIKESR
jgi:hypothetical protein